MVEFNTCSIYVRLAETNSLYVRNSWLVDVTLHMPDSA